ncbi:MAG: heparinase II/III family protein, partial [Bryobacterales bacterium]|nr:heparinase II/III family protein [Bryobacterales bacterium]
PLFNEEERQRIRQVMERRARDAWVSGEVREGVGHLNQPYGSHANRTWHKLAENAVATLGETGFSDQLLQYAVTKFYAAYPVWSDEDGGWHEGLSYFAGYMSKVTWWMHLADQALGIDGFRKPFFKHFADYAMYSAPPGTPDLGFGDLASGQPNRGWAFMQFFIAHTKNPQWAWWARQWNLPEDVDEPVLSFLWSSMGDVAPQKPSLPPSKLFRGTGVAILNTTMETAAENVQVRFKSSPMGRWSHGHDAHNSFTLSAYGEALLVNNVYRDIYGSPFHKEWVWTTRAQNAVLVNNTGQKEHSADLGGRIIKADFQDGLDYVVGDATASYQGKLDRALRHVVFVKPDVVVIGDELAASSPSTYQFLLHGHQAFEVDEANRRLILDREKAGVVVDYVAFTTLSFRQWTGYEPAPDKKYLDSISRPMIPAQWHVEASTGAAAVSNLTFTVLRPYRKGGQRPVSAVQTARGEDGMEMTITGASGVPVSMKASRDAILVKKGERQWRIERIRE